MNTNRQDAKLSGKTSHLIEPFSSVFICVNPWLKLFSVLLSVLCFLLLNTSVLAQTPVTLNTINLYGAGANATVTFTPAQQIGVSYPNYVLGAPVSVTPTNGSVTTNLLEGIYTIGFSGLAGSRRVYVPGLWITNLGYTLPLNLAVSPWLLGAGITQIIITNQLNQVNPASVSNALTQATLTGFGIVTNNGSGYALNGTWTGTVNADLSPSYGSIATAVANQIGNKLAVSNNYTGTFSGNATTATLATNAFTSVQATNDSLGRNLTSLLFTNTVQTLYQDTNALTFANRNGISDINIRSQLVTMQNIFNQLGVASNVEDIIFENPAFNPSNNLSYFGRSLSVSNLTYPDTFGCYLTNNGRIQLDNLSYDNRTGSVFVVYARPAFESQGGNNFSTFCGYFNPNSLSGEWVMAGGTEHHIGNRQGTNLIVGVLSGGSGSNPTETNLFFAPQYNGTFTFNPSTQSAGYADDLKSLWTFSWAGTNETVWDRGVQGSIDFFVNGNQGFPIGTNFIMPQEPLTTFRLGSDVMTNNTQGVLGWSGEVQLVILWNCAANSNTVKASCLAQYAVAPEKYDLKFVFDSRGIWAGNGDGFGFTNSIQYYIAQKLGLPPYTYEFNSISTMTLVGNWGTGMSNYLYNLGKLPPNITQLTISELGVNDPYVGGYSASQWFTAEKSMAYAAHTNGSLFQPMTVWGVYTNATGLIYNVGSEATISTMATMVRTNAYLWDGIWDANAYVTQNQLTTNGFSFTSDGTHWGTGTNGFIPSQAISLTGPVYCNTVQPDGNGTVNALQFGIKGGSPGFTGSFGVQTNSVGPHGITFQISGGIITNEVGY